MAAVREVINKLSTLDPDLPMWHISMGGVYDTVDVELINQCTGTEPFHIINGPHVVIE